jgi:hypothetical protein
MPPPVRVKVYGISMTRRGYLVCVGIAVVLILALAVGWLVLFWGVRPAPEERTGGGLLLLWAFFRDWLPLVLLVIAVLQVLEAFVVLRRFRRAEAEQASGAHDLTSRGS